MLLVCEKEKEKDEVEKKPQDELMIYIILFMLVFSKHVLVDNHLPNLSSSGHQ